MQVQKMSEVCNFPDTFNILDLFLSGFRPFHSKESAHPRVLNDIFLATNSGSYVVLVLLDLSAAFDTVDHGILMDRLETMIGICCRALAWFRSYFYGRCFSVRLGDCISEPACCFVVFPRDLFWALFELIFIFDH